MSESTTSVAARGRLVADRLRNTSAEAIRRVLSRRNMHLVRSEKISEYVGSLRYAVSKAEGFALPEDPHRDRLLAQLLGASVPEGVYIVNYLNASLCDQGDVCEFGVAQGATSALLANEIKSRNRTLWLYDSFEGLPESTSEDEFSSGSTKHALANPERLVHARLRQPPLSFEKYRVVKGYFHNTPDTPAPDAVCFAYIDFDLFTPILDALQFVHPRLTPSGVMLVDDYGHDVWAGVKKAVHQFLDGHPHEYRLVVPPEQYGRFCVLVRPDQS